MKVKFLCIFIMLSLFVNAEEVDKEKIISIDQERSEILLYGIDQEVKELLTTLKKDKVSGFNKELKLVLETTFDEEIKIDIYNYFEIMNIDIGEDEAFKIFDKIKYEDEYDNGIAVASINYLSHIKSKKSIDEIGGLLDTENSVILKALLEFIGENNVLSYENTLIDMLDDEDLDDEIFIEVIKTIGRIKSKKALDELISLASDEDEETSIRVALCYSLGEIGDPKALDVLKLCLSNRTNFILRKSAISAIGKFEGSNIDDILIESLRDPIWQIRLEALKSIAERKLEKAFPILKYKALKDPEARIKKEAFITIGDINSDECKDFLREVYTDKSYTESEKLSAIDKLIEYNLDWIYPEIVKLYSKDNLETRKPVLDMTLKLFSETEYKFGSELFGKMLTHENYIYKIYAIQGIRLNKFSEHLDLIKKLSVEDKNKSVKKYALAALEEF